MDLVRGLLGVLQEYPLWIRIASVVWVVLGAMLIGAFVLIPRSLASSGRTPVSVEARQRSIGSRFDATESFISLMFTQEEYGPKKDKLLPLIRDLKSKTLPAEGSREALARWNIGSDYTLDDLFIGTGFLEW